MAAPTYTWSYVENIFGMTDPPKVATMEASTSLETKKGTALIITSGQLDEATATVVKLFGLAMEATTAAATAADPIKVMILRPGDVIKGTADADASTLSGFNGVLGDFNTDGSLDVADTTNGCLAVLRTEDSGLTVYCVASVGAIIG
jgi:hypothetical protein